LNFIPLFYFCNSDHVGWRLGLSDAILEGDHPWTIPPKCGFKWPSGFRGEDLKKLVNQKKELPVVAMFGNGS
jgi:hypothetical protein